MVRVQDQQNLEGPLEDRIGLMLAADAERHVDEIADVIEIVVRKHEWQSPHVAKRERSQSGELGHEPGPLEIPVGRVLDILGVGVEGRQGAHRAQSRTRPREPSDLTRDITRFAAKESRSYVLSVSGLMRASDIPASVPHREAILASGEIMLANGGSCLAGPDGEWVIEPQSGEELLRTAVLDHRRVREERQTFDPAGHYSRPDVLRLTVNRERQSTLSLEGM